MGTESESGTELRRPPRSALFEAWARLVLRFRWPLLVAILATSAALAQQAATGLVIDPTSEGFLGKKHPAVKALRKLETNFGSDSIMQLVVRGEVFSLPYLTRLRALHGELASIDLELSTTEEQAPPTPAAAPQPDDDAFADFGMEGWEDEAGGTVIDQVLSLINVRETQWRGGGLWVGGLLDDWPSAAQMPRLRDQVLSDPKLVGQVVGAAGTHSVVLVRMQKMSEGDRNRIYDKVVEIAERHHHRDFQVQVGGPAALDANLERVMMGDFRRQMGGGLLVILLLLFAIFRHPLGVLGPVLVVVQSALWTLGTMALFGVPMTLVSNILPLFLICVGMGDSVHIQSVYRDARQRGLDNTEAIVEAVATTGTPIFYTTLTTAIGLLSFHFASLGAIGDMGTFGALGVMTALLLSITLLPIVLTLNRTSLLGVRPQRSNRAPDLLDRALELCSRATRDAPAGAGFGRRRVGLTVGVLLAVASALFATRVYVHHDPLAWIPEGYAIKDAFVAIDEHVGGASSVALMITPDDGKGLRDRDLMLGLERLEQDLRAYDGTHHGEPIIGNTTGVLDVIRESHRAVHGGSREKYQVPGTQRGVADMFTLFENSAPDELKRLATVDLGHALMTVRVKWLDASSYGPLTRHIRAAVDRHLGGLADIMLTGGVFTVFSVIQNIISDLLRSFGVAMLVITIVMISLLRDIRLGLIAMIPNLMPILAVVGIMGLAEIPLDAGNLVLASIAIGIAVDDTIHFLHQFQAHFSVYGRVEAAITHAFRHTGRALVSTSVTLAGGFLVFLLSEMQNIRTFGVLLGLSIVLALLIDLLLCPALLRTFYTDRQTATPA